MANLTFNINLNRKNIDTVFYTFNRKQTIVKTVAFLELKQKESQFLINNS